MPWPRKNDLVVDVKSTEVFLYHHPNFGEGEGKGLEEAACDSSRVECERIITLGGISAELLAACQF